MIVNKAALKSKCPVKCSMGKKNKKKTYIKSREWMPRAQGHLIYFFSDGLSKVKTRNLRWRKTFRFSWTVESKMIRGLRVLDHIFSTQGRRGAVVLTFRPAVSQ